MGEATRLLMLVGAYIAGASGLLLVLSSFTVAGRRVVQSLVGGQEAAFAWAAAVLMTASSLTLSEVFGYTPCQWCWIQRGFAYPNALVLGVVFFTRKAAAWWLALALAVLGIGASTYHILLDWKVINPKTACSSSVPCDVRWNGFEGPLSTIQVGAFCCFLFIIGMCIHALAARSSTSVEA